MNFSRHGTQTISEQGGTSTGYLGQLYVFLNSNVQGTVRTISIENTDYQPCGGTHVRNTAEIGELVVTGRTDSCFTRRATARSQSSRPAPE